MKKILHYLNGPYLWIAIIPITFVAFIFGPALIMYIMLPFADERTAQVGDTYNGVSAPFFAAIASLVTFLAFYIQYLANQKQVEQFEKQAKDLSIERFESKFYELIRLHRANVEEINVENTISGRKAFVEFFREFQFCYAVASEYIGNFKGNLVFDKDDEHIITIIVYNMFFMGVGNSSDKLTLIASEKYAEKEFLGNLSKYVNSRVVEPYRSEPYKRQKEKREFSSTWGYLKRDELVYKPKYLPFQGHIAKLGHYYRHLFQIANFIADQNFLTEDQKATYSNTLRAQLSDYEQLLLYYNTLSNLGDAWLKKENSNESLLVRFRMIKNMPVPMADFGVLPKEKFANEIEYWKTKGKKFFEWDER